MKNDRIKNGRIKSDRIKSGRIKSDRIKRITDPKRSSVLKNTVIFWAEPGKEY
jgi:hypothetical protein